MECAKFGSIHPREGTETVLTSTANGQQVRRLDRYIPERGRSHYRLANITQFSGLDRYIPERGRKQFHADILPYPVIVWIDTSPRGDGNLTTIATPPANWLSLDRYIPERGRKPVLADETLGNFCLNRYIPARGRKQCIKQAKQNLTRV